MQTKKYTIDQIRKKYNNIYIDVYRTLDYSTGDVMFEVRATSKKIKENMTLGQDVGTNLAYTR